ncbi:MAG: hypothetical protein J1E98_01620 [Lachnospiraceae bacterium]|nr:hypothetical protein [Lachnospiraceae bacterium]
MKNKYFKRALAFLLTLAMLCTSGPFGGGAVMAEAAEPEAEATEAEAVDVAEPGVEGNLGDEADVAAADAGDEVENSEKNVADTDDGDMTNDMVDEEADNNANDETDGGANNEAQVTYDDQEPESAQPLYDAGEGYWKGIVFEDAGELVDIWKNIGLLWDYEGGQSPYDEKFEYAGDLETLFSKLTKGENNGEITDGSPIAAEYVYISQTNPGVSDKTITVPATVKGLIIGNGNYYSEEDEKEIDFGVIANKLTIEGTETDVYFEKGLYIDADEGNFTIEFSSTEANNKSRVILGDNTVNGVVSCGSKNAGNDVTETIVVYGDIMLNGFINEGETKLDALIGHNPDDEEDGPRDCKFLIKDAANEHASVKGITFNKISGDTEGTIIYNGYPGEEHLALLPRFKMSIELGTVTDTNEGDGSEFTYDRGISVRFWKHSDTPFYLGDYYDDEGNNDWWQKVDAEELKAGTQVAYFVPEGEGTEDEIDEKINEIAEKVGYYNHNREKEGKDQDLYLNSNGRLALDEALYSAYSILWLAEEDFWRVREDYGLITGEFAGILNQVDSLDNLSEGNDNEAEYVVILVNEKVTDESEPDTLNLPDGIKGVLIWSRTENWPLKGISANEGCEISIDAANIDSISQDFELIIKSGVDSASRTSDEETRVIFSDSQVNGNINISGNAKVTFIDSNVEGNVTVLQGADLFFINATIKGSVTGTDNSDTTILISKQFIAKGVKNFSLFMVESYATFIVDDPDALEFNDIEFIVRDNNNENPNDENEGSYQFYFDIVYNGYPEDEGKLPVFKGEITETVDAALQDEELYCGVNMRFVKSSDSGKNFWENDDWWDDAEDEELEEGTPIAKISGSDKNLIQKIGYHNNKDYGTYYSDGWILIGQVDEGLAYRVLQFNNADDFERAKNDVDTIWEAEENYGIAWFDTDSVDDFLNGDGVNYVVIQAMKKSYELEDKTLTLPANIKGALLVSSGDGEVDTEENGTERLLPWKLNELIIQGKTEVIIDNVTFEPTGQELKLTINNAGDLQEPSDKDTTVEFIHSGVDGDINISGKADVIFINEFWAAGDIKVSDSADLYFQNADINGSVTGADSGDTAISISEKFFANGVKNISQFTVDGHATFIVKEPDKVDKVEFNDIVLNVFAKDAGITEGNEEDKEEYEFYFDLVYNGYPSDKAKLPAFKGNVTERGTLEEGHNYGIGLRFVTYSENFWENGDWWDTVEDVVLNEDVLAATTTLSDETAVMELMKRLWYTSPKQYNTEDDNNKVWFEPESNGAGGYNIVVKYAEGFAPDNKPDEPDESDKPVINSVLFPKKKETYSAVYTGEQICPVMVVAYKYTDEKGKAKTQTLKLNVDYTLRYSNNVDAGVDTASVTVKGIGEYSGNITKNFTITPKSIAKVKLSPVGDIVYTEGEEPNPVVVVTDGTYELVKDVDYEVVLSSKGSPTADTQSVLTVKGKGNYDSGTESKSSVKFNILAPIQGTSDIKPINAESVKVELKIPAKGYTYNGKQQKPKVTVTDGGVKVPASQYKVIYSNNVNACSKDAENAATVRVVGVTKKGKGYYGVTAPVKFDIGKKDFAKVKVASVPNIPLTGKVSDITFTVKDGKHILTEDEEFTVDYGAIKNPDGSIKDGIKTGEKYKITLKAVNGKNYTDDSTKEVTVKFGQLNLGSKTAKMTVTIKDPTQNKVEVVYNGVTLTDGTDYTATVKLDKKKGTYTVTIKAVKKSAYKGTKVFKGVTFTAPETEQ